MVEQNKTKLRWTGFAKKSIQERIDFLEQSALLSPDMIQDLKTNQQLPIETANQMSENVLGTFSLPFSIVPDVEVDGVTYQVPYVTEEPSVVAAASYAAKIIKRSGGFNTTVHDRQMIGQVALFNVKEIDKVRAIILDNKDKLIEIANAAHPSIVKRGGGARTVSVEEKGEFLIVYLTVDTQEAMGANMVNTMMEAISPLLEDLSGGQSLMAILSNYATSSLVTATCSIDIRFLSRDKVEAKSLAKKIEMSSRLAQVDPYRASTHNKGIFNGVDALVLATGNDWRAVEAGAHTYASGDGQYKGLTRWAYDDENHLLKGEMTLPMPIATKGGSIGLNPRVKLAHELLGEPDARTLASIIVSIGLAQNFAAIKALTSTGIQAGHMKLQAKSLALLAGAKENEVDQLVALLLNEQHMNLEVAQGKLDMMRNK